MTKISVCHNIFFQTWLRLIVLYFTSNCFAIGVRRYLTDMQGQPQEALPFSFKAAVVARSRMLCPFTLPSGVSQVKRHL